MSIPFVEQTNDRRVYEGYDGDVLIWDIDKTYLNTRFSSFRGLLAIPFEFAVDKEAITGAVALIRALRHGGRPTSALTPLYFVSGSPPQMRSVIERRMLLDGIDFDGITFKDQWGLVRARRPRDVKKQIGYKLKALLGYRREIPSTAHYLMFGDDVENDAEAFTLFGDICSGLIDHQLAAELEARNVHPDDIEVISQLVSTVVPCPDPVAQIFIHLTNKSDPRKFDGGRVLAVRSFLQAALVLAHQGRIQLERIATVSKDLRRRLVSESEIVDQLRDAEMRLSVPTEITALAQR